MCSGTSTPRSRSKPPTISTNCSARNFSAPTRNISTSWRRIAHDVRAQSVGPGRHPPPRRQGALNVEMELATLSRRGGRSYNEDACGHWHSDSHLCCVVADGAGGHGGGDKASKLAVQSILSAYAVTPEIGSEAIERTIVQTNRSIIAHRAEDSSLQNMHSTVV